MVHMLPLKVDKQLKPATYPPPVKLKVAIQREDSPCL